jgi:23S rRNA pseudouridine1911/1915/1917 synthase
MSKPIELRVNPADAGERLDRFLRRSIPGVSSGSIRRLLERGQVLVNGGPKKKGYQLRSGERVIVAVAASDERPVPQPAIALELIATFSDFVVVNKASGQHCHPLVPGETDTLANALVAAFPECADASPHAREAGLVHRLDWSTSGVIIAARNRNTYGRLRGLFSSHKMTKEYIALVDGVLEKAGHIQTEIQTMPGNPSRMRVYDLQSLGQHGRIAKTEYHPIAKLGPFSLVTLRCQTGLRHQIRVHMAYLGHPLVGDSTYEGSLHPKVTGAFLHAHAIAFEGHRFEAKLEEHRSSLLRELGYRD